MSKPAAPANPGAPGQRGGRGANFTEGPVHSHLIRLAGFMFMGFSAMTVSQLIEAVYLGVLGTDELAAVSFTFPVVMVLQSVAMGLGVGASSIIARTTGAGDREQVRRLVTHCILLAAGALVTLAILGSQLNDPIFRLLGAKGHILELIHAYMDIWFIGLPLFALSMIGTSLIRAVGNAAAPGIVMTVGSVLQVIFAPFLIFGFGPIPAHGIEGAALAFLFARLASFALCYYIIIFQERLVTRAVDGIIASWRSILHVGLPAIATNLIMPVSMGIITRLLARHGAEIIAGFGIGSRIGQMMVMIVMAVASSAGPFIGQNWGAKKYERIDTALSLANRFSMAWGVVAFLIMLAFGKYIVSIINHDPAVVDAANWYLLITPLSIGFMGMTAIASSCFNAMGQPIPPLVISIARMFIVYIPMAILFDYLWGYVGIFLATSVSTAILGVAAFMWNRHALAVSRRDRERFEAAVA
ncbi:MAG: MATE family efflux transporter [Pseudomonadales bacterium]|nr:MATE family efflux transporter [Pseudomonadales bacterium]